MNTSFFDPFIVALEQDGGTGIPAPGVPQVGGTRGPFTSWTPDKTWPPEKSTVQVIPQPTLEGMTIQEMMERYRDLLVSTRTDVDLEVELQTLLHPLAKKLASAAEIKRLIMQAPRGPAKTERALLSLLTEIAQKTMPQGETGDSGLRKALKQFATKRSLERDEQ